jgi:hypothetical protein
MSQSLKMKPLLSNEVDFKNFSIAPKLHPKGPFIQLTYKYNESLNYPLTVQTCAMYCPFGLSFYDPSKFPKGSGKGQKPAEKEPVDGSLRDSYDFTLSFDSKGNTEHARDDLQFWTNLNKVLKDAVVKNYRNYFNDCDEDCDDKFIEKTVEKNKYKGCLSKPKPRKDDPTKMYDPQLRLKLKVKAKDGTNKEFTTVAKDMKTKEVFDLKKFVNNGFKGCKVTCIVKISHMWCVSATGCGPTLNVDQMYVEFPQNQVEITLRGPDEDAVVSDEDFDAAPKFELKDSKVKSQPKVTQLQEVDDEDGDEPADDVVVKNPRKK